MAENTCSKTEAKDGSPSVHTGTHEDLIVSGLKAKPLKTREFFMRVGHSKALLARLSEMVKKGDVEVREVFKPPRYHIKYLSLSERLWKELEKRGVVSMAYLSYASRRAGGHKLFGEIADKVEGRTMETRYYDVGGKKRRPDRVLGFPEEGKKVHIEYETATHPAVCFDHLQKSMGLEDGTLVVCKNQEIKSEYKRWVTGPWSRDLSERWGTIGVTTVTEFFNSANFRTYKDYLKSVVWDQVEPQYVNPASLTRILGQTGEPLIYRLKAFRPDAIHKNAMHLITVDFTVDVQFLNAQGREAYLRSEATAIAGMIRCPVRMCPRPVLDIYHPEALSPCNHMRWLFDYVLPVLGRSDYPEVEGILKLNLERLYPPVLRLRRTFDDRRGVELLQLQTTNGRRVYVCNSHRSAVCEHVTRFLASIEPYIPPSRARPY